MSHCHFEIVLNICCTLQRDTQHTQNTRNNTNMAGDGCRSGEGIQNHTVESRIYILYNVNQNVISYTFHIIHTPRFKHNKNPQIRFHDFLCMNQGSPSVIILSKKDIFGRHTIDNFCIISLKRVHTFDGRHDSRIKMAGFKASPLGIIGAGIIFYGDDLFSHNCSTASFVIFYSFSNRIFCEVQ